MASRRKNPATPAHELTRRPGSARMLARAATTILRRPHGVPSLPQDGVRVRAVVADARRLTAYRRVCGLSAVDTLPLTYPHVMAESLQLWLMTRPGFPLPLLGLVHLANRFERSGPVAADRSLDLSVRLGAATRTEHGLEFDVTTEAAAAGGKCLWQGVSTYLYRMPNPDKVRKEPPPPPPRLDRQQALSVPADIGRRYAAVSGDYNPIHLHPLTARLFGFPRAIAHGMWSAPCCMGMLQTAWKLDPSHLDVRFRQPLLLPAGAELRSRRDGSKIEFLLVGREDRLHMEGVLD